MSAIAKEINQDPSIDATDMAVHRTVMAADRSLMAWVRTGLSLISFGFTIYKFLEISSQQLTASGKVLANVSSPKVIGLFMIGMGILSLIMGTVEYMSTIKMLQGQYDFKRPRYSLLMSAIVTVFGVIIFLSIILRLKGIG